MKISDEEIEVFIAIWKRTYGEAISKKEALKHAKQLLGLIKVVDGP